MGSVVGGIFGMAGASKQADAAKHAADVQAEAAQIGAETQREMFDQSVQLGNPWRHGGQNALGALAFELGLGPRPEFEVAPQVIGANDPQPLSALYGRTDPTQPPQGGGQQPRNALAGAGGQGDLPRGFKLVRGGEGEFDIRYDPNLATNQQMQQQAQPAPQSEAAPAPEPEPIETFQYRGFRSTPGFQFNLDEGQKAINRSLAARGMSLSGAAVKEGMRFGQGLASQEYNNHLARLAALSGVGGGFAASTGAQGVATGSNIAGTLQRGAAGQGNALQNAGAARASGYNAMGRGISEGVNALAGWAGFGGF